MSGRPPGRLAVVHSPRIRPRSDSTPPALPPHGCRASSHATPSQQPTLELCGCLPAPRQGPRRVLLVPSSLPPDRRPLRAPERVIMRVRRPQGYSKFVYGTCKGWPLEIPILQAVVPSPRWRIRDAFCPDTVCALPGHVRMAAPVAISRLRMLTLEFSLGSLLSLPLPVLARLVEALPKVQRT